MHQIRSSIHPRHLIILTVFCTIAATSPTQPNIQADLLAKRIEIVPRDGSLRYGESDIEGNATGFALAMRRCYNSASEAEGALGPGWATVFDRRLERPQRNLVILRNEWGEATTFVARGGPLMLSETGRPQWLWTEESGSILRDENGRFWTFDPDGRATGIFNQDMAGLEIEYFDGRLARVSDPYGRAIRFSVDDDGRVVEARSTAGDRRRYGYEKGRLVRVLDDEGTLAEYGYDPQGRLNTIVVNKSETAAIRYDAQGRVTHLAGDGVADRRVRYIERTVPFKALHVEVEDARGNVMRYRYRSGRPECKITLPGGEETIVSYTERNLPQRIDFPGERRIDFSYDNDGNLTRLVLPHDAFYSFDYAGRSLLSEWTRSDGLTFSIARAPSGRIRKIEAAGGAQVRRFGYDFYGRLSWIAEDENEPLLLQRNASGDISNIGVPKLPAAIQVDHDESGRLGRITTPDRPAYQVVYDGRSRPAAVGDSIGYRLGMRRDRFGRVAALEDAAGNLETFERNAAGRVAVWRRPDGAEIRFESDAEGNLIRIRMPDGNNCEFAYGPRNNAISETRLGSIRSAEYDEFGRLVSWKNARQQTMKFSHDIFGYPAGLSMGESETGKFTFDRGGRLDSMDAQGREYRFGHDPKGRPARVVDSRTRKSITYSFDAAGRIVSVAMGEAEQARDYDDAGRLTRISIIGDEPFDIRYRYLNADCPRLPSDMHLPGGTSFAYTYDRYGRPASIKGILPTGRIAFEEEYSYDGRGNIAAVRKNGRRYEHKYDPQNHLAEVQLEGKTYARFQYGKDGRLLKLESEEGGLELVYDEDGKPIRTTRARMAYDADGNRIRLTGEAGAIGYLYNAMNRLTKITLPRGGSVSQTFLPNGWMVARGWRNETAERFWRGDLPVYAEARGGRRTRWYAADAIWSRLAGSFGGPKNEIAFRDARGRLRAIGDGSDNPPTELEWGLLGWSPKGAAQLTIDALGLRSLELGPDPGRMGQYDSSSGVSLVPRSLREGLAPFGGGPDQVVEPAWADRSAGGDSQLAESLLASCAGGRFAADEGAVLRYLISTFGSPGWPVNGSPDTFDQILDGDSFLAPADILRSVTETILRDGTGGLTPLVFEPHTEAPAGLLGIGRYRVIGPSFCIRPGIVLESDRLDSIVLRDDPAFAAVDDARHTWIGRLIARSVDRARYRVGEDGTMRLAGEIQALSEWMMHVGPREEGTSLPSTEENSSADGRRAERLALRDKLMRRSPFGR